MSTDDTKTPSMERLERLDLWVAGYRQLARSGLDETVHTAETEASRIDDDTFAHLSVTDVEWLVRIARLAGRAAAEARGEMAKGRPREFTADFPASAELARTVFTAEEIQP